MTVGAEVQPAVETTAVMVPAGRWLPEPTYAMVFTVNCGCVAVLPARAFPVVKVTV